MNREIDELKRTILRLRVEIEDWKYATGLECGGDPDAVTPEMAAKYWGEIAKENEELKSRLNNDK